MSLLDSLHGVAPLHFGDYAQRDFAGRRWVELRGVDKKLAVSRQHAVQFRGM